ncbi:MAG TPA: DUF2272 domain-containing protein [Stellaceae bacterium]|nr:DUF2272 domain-containing protein [Stellaceae bacterium]
MRQPALILPAVILSVLLVAGCVAAPPPPVARLVRTPTETALTAHIPPFARWPYEPFGREAAVQIALGEWRAFRQPVVYPDTELPEDEEREDGLWQRVGLYWWLGLDPSWPQSGWTGKHDENGQVFPADRDGYYAWSAAFISYVMRLAGAGSSFPYSETHSDYIDAAARHDPGVALVAERPEAYAPQLGDLICLWRGRQVTFDELPAGRFPGHCDIVVAIKPGQLDVIGGNVDNAVAMKYVPVTADGRLATPDGTVLDPYYHWFVVLKVLYQRDGSAPPSAISAAPVVGAHPA